MRRALQGFSAVAAVWLGIHCAASAAAPPNIVLLVSDDLAATLGCYGYPLAKTPHLDQLASEGVLFERAYCQFPHCNPSRSSFLSGLRPGTTGVTDNADNLYENIPGVQTLPRYFRDHGYATARCGKIFHLGIPTGNESMDDPLAWDFGTPFKDERPYPPARKSRIPFERTPDFRMGWKEIAGDQERLVDHQFAGTAVKWLENHDRSKPFFLAVGFHRPHLPLVAPQEYFDLYDFAKVTLPDEPANDVDDIPLPARNGAVPGYKLTATAEQRRAAILAYLACVSFVDAQAGRVLDALDRLQLTQTTIVIFMSDHGWHLGEHGLWHKRSLFEECARVPLVIRVPGARANSRHCESLVELLDLYPTLCDLCGLPIPPVLQGVSLSPLLNDPARTIHSAAFTQARRGPDAENWGRSIRTDRWRCTEWDAGQNGIELYDHQNDPGEFTNLASDSRFSKVLEELRTQLAKQSPQPMQ